MRKSFTRLFGLVMFLTLLSSIVMAVDSGITSTKQWPTDGESTKAYTKPTDKILIIFSEAVKAGTGYVRLNDENGAVRVITATDSRISYAKGDTVVVDFSADQVELMRYTVSIDGGTFKPVATASGTYANVPTWSYTVGDYTGPTLTDVVPVKDATVEQTISLEMTFEDASAVELGTGKIAVYKADGNVWDLIDVAHPGTHTITLEDGILTVTGIRGLEDLTNYAVTVGAGVVTDNGLRADEKKNAYLGLTDRTVWKFNSKDFSVPGFATDYPKVGTVGTTTADILIKATEKGTAYAMFLAAGSDEPTVTDIKTANNKVTIAAANTEYKISLTGMGVATTSADFDVYVVTENTDVAATSADIKMLEVTTTENVKPTLGTIGYVKGTTITYSSVIDQAVTKLVFHFSEPVKVGAGSILIYKKSDNSVFATIDAAAITISTTNSAISLIGDAVAVLPKVFENHADYYAFIPSTLFKDKFNNFYAGVTTTTGWTFSTNDIIAPTVVSYTPAQGTVGVAVDADIVVKFSEVMAIPASGDIAANAVTPSFLVEVDGHAVAYHYEHSTNNDLFSTVTITTDAPFASSGVVTVTVNGNLEDVNENALGLTQGNSFIAKDINGPTMEFKTASPFTPATNIVVKFDEPIRLLGGTAITASNLYTIVTLKNTDENGTNVSATYAISDDKTTITITPASPWTSKGVYYVAISSDVQDGAVPANKCMDTPAARSTTYTVSDVIPAVVAIDKDGKTDVGVTNNITITFKEGSTLDAVAQLFYGGSWHSSPSAADLANVIVFKEGDANGANVPFSVSTTGTGTFVVDPNDNLTGAKTYYIGIGASTKDAGGNVNAAKYASFTTLFVAAPELVSLSPTDDQIEVALKAPVVITFNTDISLVASGSYSSPVTINGATVIYTDLVVSGKTLTIKHADFVKNTAYEVIIPSGVVLNKNTPNVPYTGVTATNWTFTTVDQTFETAFTLTPDGLVTPALDDKLVIALPEKVVAGTGNIAIKNADTDFLIEQIASTSSQVAITYSGSNTTITITPSANFVFGGKYYVEVDNGAFVDMYTNKIPAIHGKTSDGAGIGSWTFTAVDDVLSITKVTPYLTENNAIDADIIVEFNRNIKKGATGNIGFEEYKSIDGSPLQVVQYGITSSNLIISGNKLTIKHADKPFTNNSTVYLTIEDQALFADGRLVPSSVIVVKADNKKFYVGDNLAPVATVTPTWDPVAKVYSQVNTNIVITFNEDVLNAVTGVALTNDNVTFSGGIIQLLNGTMTPVDFQGSISGRTITIDPTSNLAESTTYTVRIVAGKIKDTHSHTILSNVDNIFKTVDTTIPTASVTLTGGAKAITISAITVTDTNAKYFYYVLKKESEAALTTVAEVKAGTRKAVPVSDITVTGLDASTSYVLYFVGEDSFGNVTAVKTSKKSTIDTVAPMLVSTDPANGTLNVANDKDIVLTFNEAVQVNAGAPGYIYIKDKATNAIIKTLNLTDNPTALAVITGTDSKKVKLITGFSSTMAPVQVYVELDGGLISDVAVPTANVFPGVLGSDKLYFTYEDNEVPVLVDWTGSDAEPIALTSNIQLTFSEDVQAGTGNAILYDSDDVAIEVFKGTEVSISGKVVTINPTQNFDNNTYYWIDVLSGFVKDKSANKNSNVATNAPIFYTSEDVAPYILSHFPTDTEVSKTQLYHMGYNFSENVFLNIAGLKKSLSILTDADIKNQMTFKKADGTAVPFTIEAGAKGPSSFHILVNSADVTDETSYVITIGGFMDIDGLVMQTETFNYTTDDGKAPVMVFNPADEAVNVIASDPLTITFSEPVYNWVDTSVDGLFYKPFTSENVDEVVYLMDITNLIAVAVPFDATFNGTNKFTITPTKPLISGHLYEYGLDGDVTDIKGNYIHGVGFPHLSSASVQQTWAQFTVKDTDKPTFTLNSTLVHPAPLATAVPAAEKMWIDFNEKIVVGTGSITIRYEDGTIFETISGAALSVKSDDDSMLQIAHKNFDSNAVYFVEIGEGVVTDKTGNKNVAMVDPTKWTFTTKDTFELTAKVTPVGENTPRTVSLTLSFNKVPIAEGNKFLSVYKEDGTAVYQKAVSDMAIVGKDAIYSGVALDAKQAYYARVEGGAFTDASGNTFTGIMDNSWVFSTVDNIAPKVVTLTPKDDATGVDTQTSTFVVTFDRDIAAGTGVISVRYAVSGLSFEDVNVSAAVVSGKTLTFNVSKALDSNTGFYVLIPAGAVTNTAVTKDPFAGIVNVYTWNFTTSTDQTAPKLLTWTPNATTITDNHPTLVMTFDEALVFGAGNVKIVKKSDNVTALTIPVTAAMVNGKTVTVTYSVVAPATGLDKNTDYYVLVDAGIVKDAAGNATAAVTDVAKWTFKTGPDFATPIVKIDDSLEFKVYPNPFVDFVTVLNASELSKVVVSNIAGQVVKEVVNPESTIQLNELRSGVYFISLYQDGAVIKTVKLLKR